MSFLYFYIQIALSKEEKCSSLAYYLDKALQSELGNAPNIIMGRARPFHDIKVWDGKFNFFLF
jgi:hypothetical protein